MSEPSEEFIIVEELKPGLRGINIKVRCQTKNEEREVVSKKTGETLRVTEAVIGDETGSILITLWNDDIDKVEAEQVYLIKNAYTTVFKTSLRLNIGKYGNLEKSEDDSPAEVNIENNLSDKVYEQQPRYRPRGYGSDRGGDRGGDRGDRGQSGPRYGNRKPYGRNDRGSGRPPRRRF